MSSRDALRTVFPACLLALTILSHAQAQSPESAGGISCPATVSVLESVKTSGGWKVENTKSSHALERISVFNGTAGGKEFELAPDDEQKQGNNVVQTWQLKAYRTMSIFLRCRYHDTPVVLMKDLPAPVQSCTLRFSVDRTGKITGSSRMECR